MLTLQNPDFEKEADFLWRYAKSVHQKALAETDAETKKALAFRAKELAWEALNCPGGDNSSDVYKW